MKLSLPRLLALAGYLVLFLLLCLYAPVAWFPQSRAMIWACGIGITAVALWWALKRGRG